MVDPHGGLVDVRFERVVGVRERRDGKVLRRRGHEQERGGKKDLTEHTGCQRFACVGTLTKGRDTLTPNERS